MPAVTPTDKIRARTVGNHVKLISEHLEAMRRDSHGLEYKPWKSEVDALWKRTFEQISRMSPGPQQSALDMVREEWMVYITHYGAVGGS